MTAGGEEQEGSSMFQVGESVDSAGEFTNTMLYQDDYGNLTDDPYAITGRNINAVWFTWFETQ